MQIGNPLREIIVEPIELPEPLRVDKPQRVEEPEKEPVHAD